MLRLLLSPFWWIERRTDMRVVWTTCRDFSPNIEAARNAFFQYAVTKACWIDYYGPTKLSERIGSLQ
jgi:hypothetical protein